MVTLSDYSIKKRRIEKRKAKKDKQGYECWVDAHMRKVLGRWSVFRKLASMIGVGNEDWPLAMRIGRGNQEWTLAIMLSQLAITHWRLASTPDLKT